MTGAHHPGPPAAAAAEVTLVTTAACHLCDHAHEVLRSLGRRHPLRVRTVELESPEGRALQARWRAPFPPLLILDGRLLGYGRLSERKLDRHLSARTGGEN